PPDGSHDGGGEHRSKRYHGAHPKRKWRSERREPGWRPNLTVASSRRLTGRERLPPSAVRPQARPGSAEHNAIGAAGPTPPTSGAGRPLPFAQPSPPSTNTFFLSTRESSRGKESGRGQRRNGKRAGGLDAMTDLGLDTEASRMSASSGATDWVRAEELFD